jgi:hypothetical protein
MGDVFEKRKVQKPIMSPDQMNKGIQEQIKFKKEKLDKMGKQAAVQEKLISECLKKEYM